MESSPFLRARRDRAPLCLALAGAFLATQSACITVPTADVRVRDSQAVEVRSATTNAAVLPTDATEGVLDRGTYWHTVTRERYELHLSRDAGSGELALRCDACAEPGMYLSGMRDAKLVDGDGRTLPTTSANVDVAPDRVTVDYDLCFVKGRRTCSVPAAPRLVVPMRDVVEVRRREEPVRAWGWILLGAGALAAATAAYVSLAPGGTFGERAPWALGLLVPTAVFTGVGLWEVLSPVRETVWTPPP